MASASAVALLVPGPSPRPGEVGAAPPGRETSPAVTRPPYLGTAALAVAGAAAAAAAQWVLGSHVRGFWVVAGAFAAVAARVAWHVRTRRNEKRATTLAVAECCETLAGELVAGRTPVAALESAVVAWPGLREAAEAFHLGLDVPAALRRLAERPGATELRLVAAAWQVGQESGQGLAAALRRVGDSLDARRRTARVVESELASARATARMVAVLPVAALLMGAGSGGDPLGFLLATTTGNLCAAAGLILTAAGLGWIELLAERAAR
ncbi:MAG: type II secretion system F family protein [Nocardioides sp.]|uniref:type II secretion system F family protein n=1 Tax=Nocardioides sp. TaxID=35761 RepID=UPI003F120962